MGTFCENFSFKYTVSNQGMNTYYTCLYTCAIPTSSFCFASCSACSAAAVTSLSSISPTFSCTALTKLNTMTTPNSSSAYSQILLTSVHTSCCLPVPLVTAQALLPAHHSGCYWLHTCLGVCQDSLVCM